MTMVNYTIFFEYRIFSWPQILTVEVICGCHCNLILSSHAIHVEYISIHVYKKTQDTRKSINVKEKQFELLIQSKKVQNTLSNLLPLPHPHVFTGNSIYIGGIIYFQKYCSPLTSCEICESKEYSTALKMGKTGCGLNLM